MPEKRELSRLKLLFHLRVFDRGSFKLLGHLADIHTKGMMVVSEQSQKINAVHDIKILLPEAIDSQDEVHFTAKVLWCVPYVNPLFYQSGFKIQRIDNVFVQLMESMIQTYGFHGIFHSDAVKYHRGVEGYNCAQAILKEFQNRLGVTDEQVVDYAAYGGGRAEDGICGALYAIKQLAGDIDLIKIIMQQFQEEVGSVNCDEILQLGRLSCAGCICTASRVLQRVLDEF